MVCKYLASHDCGEREGRAERNTDVGPARRSSAAAPLACMATARLTARRHEKARTRRPTWAARMVLPKGGVARVSAGSAAPCREYPDNDFTANRWLLFLQEQKVIFLSI
jgi:hypothetical protein